VEPAGVQRVAFASKLFTLYVYEDSIEDKSRADLYFAVTVSPFISFLSSLYSSAFLLEGNEHSYSLVVEITL
jgi:hypothetical protein